MYSCTELSTEAASSAGKSMAQLRFGLANLKIQLIAVITPFCQLLCTFICEKTLIFVSIDTRNILVLTFSEDTQLLIRMAFRAATTMARRMMSTSASRSAANEMSFTFGGPNAVFYSGASVKQVKFVNLRKS